MKHELFLAGFLAAVYFAYRASPAAAPDVKLPPGQSMPPSYRGVHSVDIDGLGFAELARSRRYSAIVNK